jgi:type III restriction enzyme
MSEKYLYERLVEEFGRRTLNDIELPRILTENLNPKFELRPYQIEAFQRFLCYFENEFEFKQYPSHLLYNMATGSGKTLIMAGLILYLYEKGYRNFLFFVDSTNIIEKTKDNFLTPLSSKYLFNNTLSFGTKRVFITQAANFEGTNPDDITICFTTIQKLHSDLVNEKENSITYEDFKDKKTVLIADEAHHINVSTKKQQDMEELTWEDTVKKVLEQNENNFLLEFTATHDYEHKGIVEKYRNKVIFRYDLKQFREDGYSKDVYIVQSDFGHQDRLLQALILSEYKQLVAAKHNINLKPVILFKAQKTIAQSQENKENFHALIENLTAAQIDLIKKGSDIALVKKAFAFFKDNKITCAQLVKRLKSEFHPDKCLSVNEEKEKEAQQILLNSLEERNNPIRAIFAVQKLNEGWDVLNLFDIVRCYEKRDAKAGKPGKTTTAEAQLIGRGARYFPFVVENNEDRYRRKFDKDVEHELRVIEQLHYHSINDSRYIAEIRRALIEEGIYEDDLVQRELKLKSTFTKTEFYKVGSVYINEKKPRGYQHVKAFEDLGVKRKNFAFLISTGTGKTDVLFKDDKIKANGRNLKARDIKLSDIPKHIVQNALCKRDFYAFSQLKKYFRNIDSLSDFIESDNYLAGLEITFQHDPKTLPELSNAVYFEAVKELLGHIENEIKSNTTEYEGTRTFTAHDIKIVFDPEPKILNINKNDERANGDEEFIKDREWYAFNANYGTTEEKAFVRMLDRQIDSMKQEYRNIYLIRNERHFKIHSFSDGRAFEPDFVLFLRQKSGQLLTYQLFIEPKGKHLKNNPSEKWKLDFLNEIKEEYKEKILSFNGKEKYRIIGVPFYNNEDENAFKVSLNEALQL